MQINLSEEEYVRLSMNADAALEGIDAHAKAIVLLSMMLEAIDDLNPILASTVHLSAMALLGKSIEKTAHRNALAVMKKDHADVWK